MKVFIGFGYTDRDQWIPEIIIPRIKELGHECLTGEKMHGDSLSEAIIKKIKKSNALIGFRTKRDRIEGKNTYTTSTWVSQELALAANNKIALYEIREHGIEDREGVLGDRQYFDLTALDDGNKELVIKAVEEFLTRTQKKLDREAKKKYLKLFIIVTITVLFIVSLIYLNSTSTSGEPILIDEPIISSDNDTLIVTPPQPNTSVVAIDTILSGSFSFHQNPNLTYNLSITPYYIGDSEEGDVIEPISNIQKSSFKAQRKVLNKEIRILFSAEESEFSKWVLFSTGKKATMYKANKKYNFWTKDEYYTKQRKLFKNDNKNNFYKFDYLANLDWIITSPSKWYTIKREMMEYFWNAKNYSDLIKLCEEIQESGIFEKLEKSQKDYVFFNWTNGLRRLIEKDFKNLDLVYIDIGFVAENVIKKNSELRSQLRSLVNNYNKYHTVKYDLNQNDLNAFFSMKM